MECEAVPTSLCWSSGTPTCCSCHPAAEEAIASQAEDEANASPDPCIAVPPLGPTGCRRRQSALTRWPSSRGPGGTRRPLELRGASHRALQSKLPKVHQVQWHEGLGTPLDSF
ncbi:hypothetical protein EYF80_065047 [Liparis tanakae]|uniref:Uncharacterized protein n=1 Tax=Liparis tanakae TaxID=230148 RepID=A0A4Z2E7B6_9TELE|nr:hypothetical protein EYF80_065047 [Liparis tanakae]